MIVSKKYTVLTLLDFLSKGAFICCGERENMWIGVRITDCNIAATIRALHIRSARSHSNYSLCMILSGSKIAKMY